MQIHEFYGPYFYNQQPIHEFYGGQKSQINRINKTLAKSYFSKGLYEDFFL